MNTTTNTWPSTMNPDNMMGGKKTGKDLFHKHAQNAHKRPVTKTAAVQHVKELRAYGTQQ